MTPETCSKCGSTDIIFPVNTLTGYDVVGGLQLRLKEPKDDNVWLQLRDEVFFPAKACVCGSCGFIEWYADNPSGLLKYWKRGYR